MSTLTEPSVGTVPEFALRVFDEVRDWGIASIGASFVLLAIGALVSLFKEPPNELEQQASASPSSNGE